MLFLSDFPVVLLGNTAHDGLYVEYSHIYLDILHNDRNVIAHETSATGLEY